MKLVINSVIFLLFFSATTAIAKEAQLDQWTTLGKTNNGAVLILNETSVHNIDIQVDESIDNEDGFYKNLPMTKAVEFNYRIGGRNRFAYTKACKNGSVIGLPNWKTFTRTIDFEPQYFLVEADGDASKKMIRRVCTLATYKT